MSADGEVTITRITVPTEDFTIVDESRCIYGSTHSAWPEADVITWYLEMIILIPLGIIGMTANLTTIPILLSRKLSNVFNQTLAVLAMVDTIYIILDTYRIFVRKLDHADNYFDVVFFYTRPFQSIAMNASIYLTVVIAVERYLAVSKPLSVFMGDIGGRSELRTLAMYVAPAIILAALINIPCFFEFTWQTGNKMGKSMYLELLKQK